MKILTILLFLFSFNCFSAYFTSCEIRNGVAYGYVHNRGDAFEINGNVWFYFFDNRGTLIDSEDEFEYEYVSSRDTEEIEYTDAPSEAAMCSFDISKATRETDIITDPVPGPNPTPEGRYFTNCEIRNGVAYGYVHNRGDAFEINGNVWFYFFDNRGTLIDSEDEFEYEYVSSRDTEEIEYTDAPSEATKCSFRIDAAIKN